MSRLHRKPQFRRGFERLENRALLAGNVTAAVVAGTLNLTGDASGNALLVVQTASNTWRVQGLGTTINGGNTAFLASGVTDITADLMDGNNFIRVAGGSLSGSLSLTAGTGNDSIQVGS